MLSLYVHIPFCRSRCSYCDFYHVTATKHVEAFFRALALETAFRAPMLQGRTISAIHFGGGTPSMVPVHCLAGWLEQVAALCTFSPDIEIALEANPEDLAAGVMEEMRAVGITRLSIGLQSFTDEKLRALGRAHTALESMQVTERALKQFDSVSVDLICGVPGEQMPLWKADLEQAVRLRPQHISVYMLSVEPKTLLHRNLMNGSITVPDESVQADLYEYAGRKLGEEGYHHYEVSNFCLGNHHSRYNLASWKRQPYIGFGPSAHSFYCSGWREIRTANVSALSRYIADPAAAESFREELTDEEIFTEKVFLALRINSGLCVEFLRKDNKLGLRLSERIARFEAKGWIRLAEERLYLTEKGFLFADLIAGDLIFGQAY